MLENILNLQGATILSQNEQQTIQGGIGGGTHSCGCGDWNCFHVC